MAMGLQGVLPRYCKGIVECELQLWIKLKTLCTDPFHFLLDQIIYPESLFLLSPLTGRFCSSVMIISCFYARKTILETLDAGHRCVRMHFFCFFVCVFLPIFASLCSLHILSVCWQLLTLGTDVWEGANKD